MKIVAEFPIVGVGASAGGIAALKSLLHTVSAEPNLALVLPRQYQTGRPSHLTDLVSTWTSMPTCEATDGLRPVRNSVYVANPDEVLTIEHGIFHTKPAGDSARRARINTIDSFFESLATDYGPQAIAVVLSGSGTDGAVGAVSIRQAGGIVLVQDPLTATYQEMPMGAIARGAADYILPISAISKQLVECASSSYVRPASSSSWPAGVTKSLDAIVGMISRQAGIDYREYKATPLLWRIRQCMEARRVDTFEDYETLLSGDPAELEALINRIPIHVTNFFRDPDAWEILGCDVLRPLVEDYAAHTPIRVWTPACATGEEAYSVAMLLSEYANAAQKPIDFRVFATDVSPEIVARASCGIFSEAALRSVPPERRSRFFYRMDDATYRVKKVLREQMVFAPQNLLADPPFSGLDLVTCRNLIIYLQTDAAKRVLYLLNTSLRMGGCLFLGTGEILTPRQGGFRPVSNLGRIYRKVEPASDMQLGFPNFPDRSAISTAVSAYTHRAAMEHYGLPSVLIDGNFQILHVYGNTSTVLHVPGGLSTHNLLELAQPTLVPGLRLAIKNALARQHTMVLDGLRDSGTGDLSLSLRVTPLQTARNGNSPRLLVSFIQGAQEMAHQDDTALSDHPNHVNSDNGDWPAWTEAMRMSQEELEASREELQVLNEELKATNEQLHLSYEEINRANARLREKIEELEMQGRVLSSGAVMAISLDEEFRIRWFSPGMSELFPLVLGDKGRRITDFAQTFDETNFITDVRKVMQQGQPLETEIKNSEGRWYLRCIRLYRAGSEAADGVAITFTDITTQKNVEDALHESEARLGAALIAGQMAHWRWDPEHDEAIASDTMETLFGLLPGERWKSSAQGFRLVHPDDRTRHKTMVEVAGRERRGWHTEFRIIRPCDGQVAWLEERANPSRDPLTGKTIITGLVWDITKRKRAEEALRKSEAELTLQLKRNEQLQKLST